MQFAIASLFLSALASVAMAAPATSDNTCVPVNRNCFDDQSGQPVGPCCEGLICAANRCREPPKQCIVEYSNCYDHNGQNLGPCCEGLICVASKCRNPKELIN